MFSFLFHLSPQLFHNFYNSNPVNIRQNSKCPKLIKVERKKALPSDAVLEEGRDVHGQGEGQQEGAHLDMEI